MMPGYHQPASKEKLLSSVVSAVSTSMSRLIDVETAETTLLKSFSFDAGWWYPGIISDPVNETIYCVSGSDTLYSLAMDGSSVDAVGEITKNIQAAGMGPDGLIGIGYSNLTGKNAFLPVRLL